MMFSGEGEKSTGSSFSGEKGRMCSFYRKAEDENIRILTFTLKTIHLLEAVCSGTASFH